MNSYRFTYSEHATFTESERDKVQNVAMNECESAGDWGVGIRVFFVVFFV